MDSGVLARVLRSLPAFDDPRVLVGNETADDAGVYQLTDDLALVLTVDFFTPIVDDPFTFGAISATNALSDIYAMGARPVAAIAIATFPETGLDTSILTDILRGGAAKAREAGISVIGGHTVKDPEPKYGLSVTGVIHPDRIVRNAGARPGDVLVLTKPLGTGILTTARRRDEIDDHALTQALASMTTLNRAASEAMIEVGVDAATDVTGFSLLGHLREMCVAGNVGAEIDSKEVPVFDRVVELAAEHAPGGSRANLENAIANGAQFDAHIQPAMQLVLADAQTSGGLLIAVPEPRLESLMKAMRAHGVTAPAVVGRIVAGSTIRVH
jgi:selenide,water dikinase